VFLTKTERDLLLQSREFSKTQQRYIRYKLNRKIKQFYGIELPLLIDKGYIVAANSCGVAAGSHASDNSGSRLVKIPPQTWGTSEDIEIEKERFGGPKGIRTLDPRHVKAVS
jgi:hypothetical protein